jgi:APA family basic amino acid/polyamine antiporter
MLGAGVFSAFAPAARAAGAGLLVGLVVAGAVAFVNATSSAQLAAVYPASGGSYVYGREELGKFWGFLAGWSFVVGKLASLCAMALTFGTYVAPSAARPLAVAAVLALTGVNLLGVTKTAAVTRVVVCAVLASLAVAVVACFGGGAADAGRLTPLWPDSGAHGILESAGFLFFAFAGYARIATLGEEVADPRRTIPRAIPLAFGIVLAVYAVVGTASLTVLGADGLAGSAAPLADAVRAGDLEALTPLVLAGAAVPSLGVLLSLLAGVGRTTFAMASEGDLPRALASVHPRTSVPDRAELAVGLVVAVAVANVDLRSAIGFSSFTVLVYYAVANSSAFRLRRRERRRAAWLPALGVVGCAAVALALPLESVVAGASVVVVGALVHAVRRIPRRGVSPPRPPQ